MLTHLRDLRVKRGMSLRKLESSSGISRTDINDIENGKRMPKIDTVYMLAQALAIPPGKLFVILVRDEGFYKACKLKAADTTV